MAIEPMDEEKQLQQSVDDAHSDEIDHVVQETKAMKMTEKVKVLKEQDEPLDFSSKKSAGVADEGQTHWNHSATSVFSQTSLKTPQDKESRDSDVSDNCSQRRERSPNCSMTDEGCRLGSSRMQSMHSTNAGYEAGGGSVTGNASARPAEVHRPIEDSRQSKRTRHLARSSKSVNRAHEENNNEMSYSGHARRSGDDCVSDGNNENVIDSRQINRRAIHQLGLLQATAGLGASNGCSPPEVAGYGDNGYDLYNHLLDRHSALVNGGTCRPNRTLNSFNPGQSMGQPPVHHHHMQRYPSLPSTVDSTATPNMSNSVRQLPIHEGHHDSRAQLRQRLTLENLFFQHQQLLQQQQQQELLQQHQEQLQHRERSTELLGDGRKSRRCFEATVRRPAIENPGIRPNCTAFPGNYRSPRAFTFDCPQSSHDDSGGSSEKRVSPGTPKCTSTSCSPTAFVDNQTQQTRTVYNHNDFRPSSIANLPNPLVSSLFPSPSTARNFTNNIPAAAASSTATSPTDVVLRPASNSSDSMDTMSSHSSSHLGDRATATSSCSPVESVSSVQRSTNGSRGSYERQNSTSSSVVVNRSNSRTVTPTTMTTEMRNGQNSRKRGRSLPEELKNAEYWERRRKNNEAAKRSRDARRAKEDEIALRAAFLERENRELRVEVESLKRETSELRYMLYTPPELRPRIV